MDGGDPKCHQLGLTCPCPESQGISRVLMAGTHMWIASAVVTLGRRFLSPVLMKPSKINTCLENKPKKKNMVLQQLSPVPTGPFLNLVFSAGNLDSARAAPRHLRCGRRSGRRPLGGLSPARASIKTLSWRWCQMTFFPSTAAP